MISTAPIHISNIFSKKKSVVKKELAKEIIISPRRIETMFEKPLLNPEAKKPLPYVENSLSKLLQDKNFSSLQKPTIFKENKKAIVFNDTPKEIAKILKKNPAYMNYYHLIRERIKTNAYRNYKGKKKGEVLVSFLVRRNGSLESVKFNAQLTENQALANMALKSVEESAPFPEFPEELTKYSHLQFNISIYFKNN